MEIYLTKLILNRHCPNVQRDLGNPQELHKTISGVFPKIENQAHLPKHLRETPRHRFDILHRLEVDKHLGQAILLVQSAVKPDWSFLPPDYADEIMPKSVHEQYERIENGMVLMFRLQANPTKRIGNSDQIANERFKDPKKRRRVELRTDVEKLTWLKRKGAELGFRLTNVKVAPIPNVASVEAGKLQGWRKDSDRPMTFGSVIFEGILEVADAERFREALQKGIGTGKAYGFGLLSVAPVKEN